ncbi:hypothetical protein F4804DRAFT_322111 [Jackrogersella minutella]|nr:hypothetical protein F4804DRAFT_322111 [Jackrogersella minutella]
MSHLNITLEPSPLFGHPPWLGFSHDGYPVVPLAEYLKVRKHNILSGGVRGIAASTQSLLTFGLLEAVVEKPIPESTLVKNESNRLVMTKEGISEILQDFIERIGRGREEDLDPWSKRVETTLSQAHSMMISFLRISFSVFDVLGDDAPSMVCLIALIGEALVNAKMVFPVGLVRQGFSWSMVWCPPHRKMLVQKMIADGWCPSVVEYLINTTSVSSLEYASLCGPMEDDKYHGDCSTEACNTYNIDEKVYTQKHAYSCKLTEISTACRNSIPPLEQVKEVLLGNGIPVITVDDGPCDRSVHLTVHRSSDIEYVAVSHVWADGLGGTTESGLPSCQLRRLASLVSEIKPGAAFWIDGICIPKEKDLRKKAIGMMGQTYREAAAVLVLDSGLQLCHSTEPPAAKILRVLASGWMRRLWTLQEAVLARTLYLVFADTSLLLTDLMPLPKDMLLFPELTDLAGELFRLTKLSRFNSYSIGDVARSLKWRTTSRPPDETLAIASLLGAHASVLVDLNPENRMIRLIQDVAQFPRNVLFLSGMKLQVPGFRWAPVSFMDAHRGSTGGLQLSTQEPDAVLTACGLRSMYYALLFKKTTFEPGQPRRLKNEKTNRFYEVMRGVVPSTGSFTCDMLLMLESIPAGNASPCVAVLRSPEHPEVGVDGTFTVKCEYKRRLVISDGLRDTGPAIDVISVYLSGKLSVCVS